MATNAPGNDPKITHIEKPNVDEANKSQDSAHSAAAGYVKSATNKTESIWQRIKNFFIWMVGPISRAISSLFTSSKSSTTVDRSSEASTDKLNEDSQSAKNSSNDISKSLENKLSGTYNAASQAKTNTPPDSTKLPDDQINEENYTSNLSQVDDTNRPKFEGDNLMSFDEVDIYNNIIKNRTTESSHNPVEVLDLTFKLPENLLVLHREYAEAIDAIHNTYLEQADKLNSSLEFVNQAQRLHQQLRTSLINLSHATIQKNADATPKAFTKFLAQYCYYLAFTKVKLDNSQFLDFEYSTIYGNEEVKVDFYINGKLMHYCFKKFSFEENSNQFQTMKNFQEMQNHFIQIDRCSHTQKEVHGITEDTLFWMKSFSESCEYAKYLYLKNTDIANMMPTAFDAGSCTEVECIEIAMVDKDRINPTAVVNGEVTNFSTKRVYGGMGNFVFRKILEIAGMNSEINFKDITPEKLENLYTKAYAKLYDAGYHDDEINKLIGVQIAATPGIPLGVIGLKLKSKFAKTNKMFDELCRMQLDYAGKSTGDEFNDYYGITYPALVSNNNLNKEITAIVNKIANSKQNATDAEKQNFIAKFKPLIEKYAEESRKKTEEFIKSLPSYVAGKSQEESVIANMLLSRLTKVEAQIKINMHKTGAENVRFTPLAMSRNVVNSWGMIVPEGGSVNDRESLQGDVYKFADTPEPYGLSYITHNQALGAVQSSNFTDNNGYTQKVFKMLFGGKCSFSCSHIFSFTPSGKTGSNAGKSTGAEQKALNEKAVKDPAYYKECIMESIKATVLAAMSEENKHLALTYDLIRINAGAKDTDENLFISKKMYPSLIKEVLSKDYEVKGKMVKLAEFFESITLVDATES